MQSLVVPLLLLLNIAQGDATENISSSYETTMADLRPNLLVTGQPGGSEAVIDWVYGSADLPRDLCVGPGEDSTNSRGAVCNSAVQGAGWCSSGTPVLASATTWSTSPPPSLIGTAK